jgi:maltooligosyltrehalose trehalohydrolase
LVPGARVTADGVDYCVWAPDHRTLSVRVERQGSGGSETFGLEHRDDGYFIGRDEYGRAGDRYWFVTADGLARPDPASRFQPDGVHGPSECIDPHGYVWRTPLRRQGWQGGAIYELHVGTFTADGTFRSAMERLDHLRDLGVAAIELMPVADFPGRWNWGYDGVALYAPAHVYGRPDDLRALVDAAHERGLAVILDVVYNHFGPDGNCLPHYGAEYFHPTRLTPWGKAFNFDGARSRPVRDFFVGNAIYWLEEFRIDGLRLDAVHAIEDQSPRHLTAEIAAAVHARGGFVIAEDERNLASPLRGSEETRIDAVWADDFHHEMRVALTGARDSYFSSYAGTPAALAQTLREGWFYTGQPFPFQDGRPRGESAADLPPSAFVHCLENHDQIGNRALGERLEQLVSPAAFRAASALLCFSPFAPLLFMGQEWAASTPFLYFTDHEGALGREVTAGRRREFAGRWTEADNVPDPQSEETFFASKLRWRELEQRSHAAIFALYQECLRQRKTWLDRETAARGHWEAGTLERALVLRYRRKDGNDRLVVSVLHGPTRLALADDPLTRPPGHAAWRLAFDSDSARYGASGSARQIVPEDVGGDATPILDHLKFDEPATVLLEGSNR